MTTKKQAKKNKATSASTKKAAPQPKASLKEKSDLIQPHTEHKELEDQRGPCTESTKCCDSGLIEVELIGDAKVPTKAHDSDAGFDLYATEDIVIRPSQRVLIPLGIKVSIPRGYYGFVGEKSGRSYKEGLAVLGRVVDPGYRGEVQVIAWNTRTYIDDPKTKRASIQINKGEKVAQLIIHRIHESSSFKVVESLSPTDRGEGGFGSTGK